MAKKQLTFGEILRREREALGLSLRAVERLTGVDYASVARYERDEVRPLFGAVVKLGRLYKLNLEELGRTVK